ncbi:chitotriosidase-1-like [Dermacentor variabilis]|uniref:chitotriosidase-1-like n=1 Tax=Dermacentor variabilis TaxID=34621 RepID=UPI003F5C2A4F
MSVSPLSLLPSTANLGDGECQCSAEGDCSSQCPSPAQPPAVSNRVLGAGSWVRCIAVASACMLAVQFVLLVVFFLLPKVRHPTPPLPTNERTHRLQNCHQPEEKNRLRYVPDHLLRSNRSRDVDPSMVPIFCVFHNSAYRQFKKVRYRLGTVPHSLCTHLLYHSAKYSAGRIASRDTLFDEIYQGFTIAANVRRIWKHIRVLLTLFVSEPETAEFSESIQSGRDVIFFGEAAYGWLTSHRYDGLNLDWPYAGGPCGSASDVSRYTALLRFLKTRLESRFMLTVTVPGELEDVSRGVDLHAASEVADFLLLRSHRRRNLDPFQYDCPGHAVAPVFFALRALAPNAKICFSISFEVRAFKSAANRSETDTRMEPADPTRYTGTAGLRAFSEVCRASDVRMDPVKYCTLASASRTVKLALETPRSIRQKLTVLSKPCVVLWDMEFDDFEGRCSPASRDPWPLAAAAYNALN